MDKLRGIVLAGGLGTRLGHLTKVLNKHLLPIYDKPMIYYALDKMAEAGIKDVLVVTGDKNAGNMVQALGNGSEWGFEKFYYAFQAGNGGIADALRLAEDFSNHEPILVILGDNVFSDNLKPATNSYFNNDYHERGAMVFLKPTNEAQRFGVAEVVNNKIISIEEKPKQPKSNLAVCGIYLYDGQVFDFIKQIKPSSRGELEITDVNNMYISNSILRYSILTGEWTDAGTYDSLLKASELRKQKLI